MKKLIDFIMRKFAALASVIAAMFGSSQAQTSREIKSRSTISADPLKTGVDMPVFVGSGSAEFHPRKHPKSTYRAQQRKAKQRKKSKHR